MTTVTIELKKEMGWTLLSKSSDTQIVSSEGGDLAYWRLGIDPNTTGHKMEIGDLVTFSDDVYLRSQGETDISISANDFLYTFNYSGGDILEPYEIEEYQQVIVTGELRVDAELTLNGELALA